MLRLKRKFWRTMLLGTLVCSLSGIHAEAEGEIYRKPFLSGTTQTWIYEGETYDWKDGKNRVFADDLEDGDLTESVKQISSNVDPSKAGDYTAVYEVTDKDGKTARMSAAVKVVPRGDTSEKTVRRTLYTLGDASHLTNISVNRGYYHDRQNLGIWLPEGAQLEIRLVNGAEFGENLWIDFMNQDQQTESYAVIPPSGEYVTVKNSFTGADGVERSRDSVPFIVTPKCTDIQPIVEFKWNENIREIPYYRYKDRNEQKFFDEWKASNAPYAILEGNAATFLVPVRDRDKIINSSYTSNPAYRFAAIDEMMEWYDAFVKQYDTYAGLDFHAEEPHNQNIRSRFFIKANEHGYGQAYYATDHSAYNGNSLNAYLTKSWLSLHEFAHGYEGAIATREHPFVETTNNIMGHYFEETYRAPDDYGWMLNGKRGSTAEEKMAVMEERARTRRNETQTFSGIVAGGGHYDVSLYMFINALDYLGPQKTVAAMHEQYRETYYKTGKHSSSSDVITESFSSAGGKNMIPYFETWHIAPSARVKDRIYEQDAPMAYYLKDLIKDEASARAVMKTLGLKGVYSLVSTDDLAESGVQSKVELHIQIDDLSQLEDRKILVKNGAKIVKEVPVAAETLEIALPAGIYELELPAPKTLAYAYENTYLLAAQGSVKKEIVYEKETGNLLTDDMQIRLEGIANTIFGIATVDTSRETLIWETRAVTPHGYFGNDEYARVRVLDQNGKEQFRQSVTGSEELRESRQEIAFPMGAKLEIYHREASTRVRVSSMYLGEDWAKYGVQNGETTVVYVMTPYGLMKEGWSTEEQEERYAAMLNQYSEFAAANMERADFLDADAMHREKLLIKNAFDRLSEEQQEAYRGKWNVLLGEEGSYVVYDKIPSQNLSAVADSVSSAGSDGKAAAAVDGNENTFWHSNYSGVSEPDIANNRNNSFTIILNEQTDIGKLEYVPRPGGGNGTILSYALFYSTTDDQEDFKEIPAAHTVWENNGNKKSVEFMAKGAKRIRIRALSTAGKTPDKYISAAEFYLYHVTEIEVKKEPDDQGGTEPPTDPIVPITPVEPTPGGDQDQNGGADQDGSQGGGTGVVTQPVEKPAKMKLLKVKRSGGKALLKWKKVKKADGIEIWMKQNKGKFKKKKTVAAKKTSFQVKKLKKGKKYTFKIRAYNKGADGSKVYGAFSKTKSVKIK